MKEQLLLYGVCAAIAFGAVAITSLIKVIVCAIAKRCGGDLSGNIKEYVFTPLAIGLAAAGLYIWLDRYIGMKNDDTFILTIVLFSVGTMVIYWLLFQPTRKFASAIIRAVAKKTHTEPIVDVVETFIDGKESVQKETNKEEKIAKEEKTAAQTLQEMVNSIKNK